MEKGYMIGNRFYPISEQTQQYERKQKMKWRILYLFVIVIVFSYIILFTKGQGWW
jgi:hypothetical protein